MAKNEFVEEEARWLRPWPSKCCSRAAVELAARRVAVELTLALVWSGVLFPLVDGCRGFLFLGTWFPGFEEEEYQCQQHW